MFVTKLNASGTGMVFSTYLGGTDIDVGSGIALDVADNIYITGYTIGRLSCYRRSLPEH